MTNRISSSAALAYRGTQASNPPNWLVYKRDPTARDNQNVSLGDLWLNQLTREAWMLVSLAGNNSNHGQLIAVWLQIAKNIIATLTGNTGGPVSTDINQNINLRGDGTTITVVGNAGTNTLTMSLLGSGFGETFTGNSGGAVHANSSGNINLVGDGTTMIFTGNPGTNTLTASIINPLDLTFTGNTGGPVTPDLFGNFNLVGDGVDIEVVGNPGTSTLTMSIIGELSSSTLTGDTGGPVSSGTGNNINLLGGSGLLAEGDPGDNLILLTQASSLATTYTTDAGTAFPAANILNIHGGTDIGTTGSGNTVTANLDGTLSGITNLTVNNLTVNTSATLGYLTEGVVQTNSSGVVSSSKGTDGQILISSTAGVPAWANITAGSNISIINSGNSITVSKSGSAGGNGWVLIGTINNYTGTFTSGITTAYRTLALVVHRAAIATSPSPGGKVTLLVQLSDNGGASYYNTNYTSGANFNYTYSLNTPYNVTSTNAFVINQFYVIGTYSYCSGVTYLYNVNNAASNVLMNTTGISTSFASYIRYVSASGVYTGPRTGPINAINVTVVGTVTTPLPPSTISLYGLTY